MKKFFVLLFVFNGFLANAQFNLDAPWLKNLKKSNNQANELNFAEVQKAFNDYWKTHDPNIKGSGYKPFKRWEYIWEYNVDDEGKLPTAKDKWLAWEHKQAFAEKVLLSDLSNWEAIGPFTHTNTGSWSSGQARINAIAIDPKNSSIWYVGTPAGGLWKSINAGQNWEPLTDNLPQIGVSGIAIDYNNSDIIYIATGDDDGADTSSAGVFKSLDGGATWNTTGLNPENTPSSMNEIYMNPDNSNILWVATNLGLFKTLDGGTTWDNILSGNIKDIKLKPDNPDVMYAVTPNQFFRSENGGTSFNRIADGVPTGGSRMVIDVTPANSNYVYILSANQDQSFQGVYRSTDSGLSFEARNTTTDVLESSQAYYDLALGVSHNNPDEIFVGCLNVWRSTNGGTSFFKVNNWSSPFDTSYTHADIHMIRFFGNELFVCSDGGIYSSLNSGSLFTDYTAGIQASQFYKVAISPTDPNKLMGGLQDNGGHAYNDGNGNWLNYYGADGMDTAIDPTNDNKYYGFIQNGGGLYISSNAGSTNTGYADKPLESSGNWVTPLAMSPTGALYAGYDNLYLLNDTEEGWVQLASLNGSATQMEIAPSDESIMYISVGSILKKTTDSGNTVSDVYTFGGVIKGIAIHNLNPDIIWVTTSTSVQKSEDGGNTFQNVSGNLPVGDKYFFINDIVHQPGHSQNPIYIGTSIGVYRSVDGGSWTTFFNNLPTTIVNDLEINVNSGQIIAATYGRGIWRSSLPDCLTITATQQGAIDSGSFENTNNFSVCTGQNIELTSIINTGTNPTYDWKGPNGIISSGSSLIIENLETNMAGEYILTISADETCGFAEFVYVLDIEEANAPVFTDFQTCENSELTINLSGSADFKWYETSTTPDAFHTGNTFTTPALTENTTYYVSGTSGLLVSETVNSPNISTATDYDRHQGLIFNTKGNIILESFTMSAIVDGERTIQVSDVSGNVIASTTVFIPSGESEVVVNFEIPKGQNHTLMIPNGLVQMRRTPIGNGVSYPYLTDSEVVTITGNTVNAPDYYYFFYDWKFTSTGGRCETERFAVNVEVSSENPDLSSGYLQYEINEEDPTGFNNNETIAVSEGDNITLSVLGSTSDRTINWTAPNGQVFTVNSLNFDNVQIDETPEGEWTIEVSYNNSCSLANQGINFTVEINPVLNIRDLGKDIFTIFPNPFSSKITIQTSKNLKDIAVKIIDLSGRIVTSDYIVSRDNDIYEFNTQHLPQGAYFLQIRSENYKLVKKIIKI